MACKSPLLRIPVKYAEDLPPHIAKQVRQNSGLVVGQDYYPILSQYLNLSNLQEIPCGHCIECYQKRCRDWALRIMLESKSHQHNYFITLTYSDAFLPKKPDDILGYVDYNGDIFDCELNIKDFQDFMKRLRRKFENEFDVTGLRIAYCGEYGELTQRPHFHFVLMGSPDLLPYLQFKRKERKCGEVIISYKCPLIEEIWGKGIVEVSDLTFTSASYVAGYVFKKQFKGDYKPPEVPEGYQLRCPPFFHVSNRPGIGRNYFDENYREIYSDDFILMKKRFKVLTLKPPRYYDKLFDVIDPSSLASLKESRERSVKLNTDIAHFDYLRKVGEIKEREAKITKGRNVGL